MPFDIPTLPELISREQSALAGSSALQRSDAEVLARVFAAASYGRYGQQAYIADQILPDTADEDTLRRMATVRLKRDRLPAVAADGPVLFTGAANAPIDAGVLLQRDDGVQFKVVAGGVVGALDVVAVDAGQLGNTEPGAVLRLVSPVLGVNETATVAGTGIEGGTEQETIEALRARVIRSYRVIPHGGSQSDYETWALEVPGVTRAWIVRHWMGPGTVAVFFVRDNDVDPIPSEEARAEVLAYIEQERPVTAEVYAPPLVEKPVQYQIKVSPDSSAVRRAVEGELLDLHQRESDLGAELLLSHIREAISSATGERDHDLVFPAGNVEAATNELLTYGGVTWL